MKKRSHHRTSSRQQRKLKNLHPKNDQPRRKDKPITFVTEFFPVETIDREAPYRFLVQHAPYGIGVIQNNQLVLANPTLARILGYRSSADIEGKPILDFVEEGARRPFNLLAQRKLRDEAIPSKFEVRLTRPDSTRVEVEVSFALGFYNGASALSISVSDITDRKELEKRQSESDRLFRNVVNSIIDALVITDLQGKVLDVNDEFERLTGYKRREVYGKEIPYPWVSEDDLSNYLRWLKKLRENNYIKDFDTNWIRKDGSRIALSLSTTLLRNAIGKPALMVNIARDISERQNAQRELKQQFQRLQVLYELTRALTETWDIQEIAERTYQQVKRVIPTDTFFIHLYEGTKNTLRPIFVVNSVNGQKGVKELFESFVPLEEAAACAKVVASRESVLELRPGGVKESHHLPSGNKQKPSASLMYVPMFSKDRIIGILSVQSYQPQAYSTDRLALLESVASVAAIAIEKVKLYQETIAKSQEIEARNKELDDFTYVVSHDLKEPLISVEGYTKILRKEYDQTFDETGRQFLRSILEACAHMKKLIEDLLQLSRVGKLAEMKHDVDLAWLIAEVIEELRFTIQERKAEIKIAEDLPKVVSVEPYLKIVYRNLISNAIKFCDKAVPVVEIGVRKEDSPVFFVKDNGIGISQEYFGKIFMIFQRLHKREEYDGTGAGLTISKKIIEVHGGRIWVESVPGVGSTFCFTLPT